MNDPCIPQDEVSTTISETIRSWLRICRILYGKVKTSQLDQPHMYKIHVQFEL